MEPEEPYNKLLEQLMAKVENANNRLEQEYMKAYEGFREQFEFVDGLDKEAMSALSNIIDGIVASSNPTAIANYWRGYIASKLQDKFHSDPWDSLLGIDRLQEFLEKGES